MCSDILGELRARDSPAALCVLGGLVRTLRVVQYIGVESGVEWSGEWSGVEWSGELS